MSEVTTETGATSTSTTDDANTQRSGSADVNTEQAPDGIADREFFNVHDGTKGRLEGVYLDGEERREAETLRAKLENREPNYDDAPAVAGTPLVVKGSLIDNSVMSNPSMAAVDSEVVPFATLPVDHSDQPADVDTTYAEQVAAEDETRGTNTVITGPGAPTETENASDEGTAANVVAANSITETEAGTPDNGGVADPTTSTTWS